MTITITQYLMGRDKQYTLPPEVVPNATELLKRVNKLLEIYTAATGKVVDRVNSGWRPPQINAATLGAAKKSNHMIGMAIDMGDPDGLLDKWLTTPAGVSALSTCDLWIEGAAHTPTWTHFQSKPYGSWTPGKPRSFSI
jgi:hypothetical protein